MNTASPRLWIAGTAALSVLLVLAAWFLLIAPKRAQAADLRQQTVDTAASNATLEARVAELKLQSAELPARKAELDLGRRAMPQDPELATLTRDLSAIAADTGVTLMSITPGVPAAVLSTTPAAAAPAGDPAAASDPAAAAAAAPTATGLSQISLSVQVVGPFAASTAFLDRVQTDLERALAVDGLNVQAEKAADATGGKPAVTNGDVTFTLTGRVFVLDPEATSTTASAAGGTTTTAPAAATTDS